ncbi:MAG: glycosyltransferase family 4 protein [Nitrospirae bacterium]|nr:glycosyltransferase family 4 protein [Nitrospirota bacterium]
MKILILSSYLGRPGSAVGGCETYTEILARLLSDLSHDVILGCWQEGTLSLAHISRTLRTRRVRIRNAMDIGAIIKIIRIIRQDRISVIIANSPKEYWPALIAARLTATEVILVRHLTLRLSPATRSMINIAADRIIAVSHSVRRALLDSGIRENIIRVVTNSVPVDEIAGSIGERGVTRVELGFRPDDLVIGFAGRLHPEKGLIFLINAFRLLADRFPQTRLLIVGEGPDRGGIEKKITELGIADRVIFTGWVMPIYRMYAAMDIFVMPSICEEAFGYAAAEAMAMGKPVVASDYGGLTEIITSGTDGILVPPGNSDALAAAITHLIQDPDQSKAYGRAGHEKVRRLFSSRIQGDMIQNLIRDIRRGGAGS